MSEQIPESEPNPTPAEALPLDVWENQDIHDVLTAVSAAAVDVAEDHDLSEAARDRVFRAGRTLAQGVAAAVLVGAGPVVWDVLRHDPTNVTGASTAFGTAALAAVVAYFHKRK